MRFSTAMAVWAAAAAADIVAMTVQFLILSGAHVADYVVADPAGTAVSVVGIGVGLAAVLTLPAFWLLERLRLLRWWTAVLSALAWVALGLVVLLWQTRYSHTVWVLIILLAETSWVPVMGSLAGWAVWRRTQPRKTPVPEVF